MQFHFIPPQNTLCSHYLHLLFTKMNPLVSANVVTQANKHHRARSLQSRGLTALITRKDREQITVVRTRGQKPQRTVVVTVKEHGDLRNSGQRSRRQVDKDETGCQRQD